MTIHISKKEIKQKLAEGYFRISLHAAQRMNERLVLEADIKCCGRTARAIKFQPDQGTWKVTGSDLDGEKLSVVCAVHEGILIVTVF